MENRQLTFLSLLVLFVSSLGTFSLIDSGLINISGAVTDTGSISLVVAGAAGCALHSVDGTSNTSVAFTAAPDSTVQTDNGDATGGTLVLNNTGNTYLNVSINSTNTSTGGFFSGSAVSSDYQVKAGHLCSANGDASNGVTETYSDTETSHRQLVADFNFTNGNNSCEIDIKIHVPVDEPVGDKLDRIYINCTETTITPAGPPAQFSDEILRSTDIDSNDTTENLTAHFSFGALNTAIYDWRINGTSIALLNMHFDNNSASFVADYTSYDNDGKANSTSWRNASVCNLDPIAGGCYLFEGAQDISFGSLGETFSAMSVFAWVKPTQVLNQTFSVSAQDTFPADVSFRTDGTKMFVLGSTELNEYDLDRPWDIASASFSQDVSVANERGVFFREDGLKFFLVGPGTDNVTDYSLSTAWDVSTATKNHTFDISTQTTDGADVFFKPDGTKMIVLDADNNSYIDYALSTPWDLSTASHNLTADANTGGDGLFFKFDGTKLFFLKGDTDTIIEYDLSTAWDIQTISSASGSFSVGKEENIPKGLFIRPNSSHMFIIGYGTDAVHGYGIVTPWDIITSYFISGLQTVVSVANSGGGNELVLNLSTDRKVSALIDGSIRGTSTNSIPYDEWSMVGWAWDGSNGAIYLNGTEDSAFSFTGSLDFDSCTGFIGSDPTSGCIATRGTYFEGYADAVQVYDRRLSAGQIAEIYNSSSPRYNFTLFNETVAGNTWTVNVVESTNSSDSATLSNSLTILD